MQSFATPFDEETIIIGAGPSGLSAALVLCRKGVSPLVLERDDGVGGLMRTLKWGDFAVDLGRKELYTRFPEVDRLWNEMLGGDYAPYQHRVGSLYHGRILELSGKYRGILRGIPAVWLIAGGWSMIRGWLAAATRSPANFEDYWHDRVGSVFSRLLAQGYWEKFRGRHWREMPAPEAQTNSTSFGMIGAALDLAKRGGVQTQAAWRHPIRGTGQLFEMLHREIQALGGRVKLAADVTGIYPRPDGSFDIQSQEGGETRTRSARRVISSLPIERLASLLCWQDAAVNADSDARELRRSVILVFIFLAEPPRFPHAWLEVNDPAMSCGRITNFAALGARMVPAGFSALCVEFFCQVDDGVMELSDEAVTRLAIDELTLCSLIDPPHLMGSMVRRLPRTNAAASWREQQTETRQALLTRLTSYANLYHVNRPGSDWASLAGLLAAEAIVIGDRTVFDRRADPTVQHRDAPTEPGAPPAAAPAIGIST